MRHFVLAALMMMAAMATIEIVCPKNADAACYGGNARREIVGVLPDLFFTAGVPETKYLNPVYTVFDPHGVGVDCGEGARSTTPGVVVGSAYGCPGTPGCPPNYFPQGSWAPVANSVGPATFYFQPNPAYHTPIPVFYNGSSPAGTTGTVDFAVSLDDIGSIGPVHARANVYIVSGTPPETALLVTSSVSTISGDSMTLDHSLLNGKPNARVFAQHYSTDSTWNHPTAVWYDYSATRWKIRNEDGVSMVSMPSGLSFSVHIDPTALMIHTAATNQSYFLIIDDPVANNNPFATIIVTPFSAGTRRMNHPYAVEYVAPHWRVVFTDGASMPTTETRCCPWFSWYSGFFVKVMGASQYVDDTRQSDPSGFTNTYLSNGGGIDLYAAYGRASGSRKILTFCWTSNAFEPIIATFNRTPLPPFAPINYNWNEAKYYGVGEFGPWMTIFHEDGSVLDGRVPFNVWGPYRAGCPPN